MTPAQLIIGLFAGVASVISMALSRQCVEDATEPYNIPVTGCWIRSLIFFVVACFAGTASLCVFFVPNFLGE
jgi:hypothetical protein